MFPMYDSVNFTISESSTTYERATQLIKKGLITSVGIQNFKKHLVIVNVQHIGDGITLIRLMIN